MPQPVRESQGEAVRHRQGPARLIARNLLQHADGEPAAGAGVVGRSLG